MTYKELHEMLSLQLKQNPSIANRPVYVRQKYSYSLREIISLVKEPSIDDGDGIWLESEVDPSNSILPE